MCRWVLIERMGQGRGKEGKGRSTEKGEEGGKGGEGKEDGMTLQLPEHWRSLEKVQAMEDVQVGAD